jgi:hypothetical protein
MKKHYSAQKKHSSILYAWNFRYALTVFVLVTGCISANAQTRNTIGSAGFSVPGAGISNRERMGSVIFFTCYIIIYPQHLNPFIH